MSCSREAEHYRKAGSSRGGPTAQPRDAEAAGEACKQRNNDQND
jgi:hypothetical protein